jgi:hypothetical protein
MLSVPWKVLRETPGAFDAHTIRPCDTQPNFSQGDEMEMLTTEQAAKILALEPTTLEQWRARKGTSPKGPMRPLPFFKIGNGGSARVRYDRVDVLEFLNRWRVNPGERQRATASDLAHPSR